VKSGENLEGFLRGRSRGRCDYRAMKQFATKCNMNGGGWAPYWSTTVCNEMQHRFAPMPPIEVRPYLVATSVPNEVAVLTLSNVPF
jgi:hypothetical protein